MPTPLVLELAAVSRLRNVERAELELSSGGSLLVGGNGQGKTTLLEGMYMLGAVRSFRGSRAADLVQHGASSSTVSGRLHVGEPCSEVVVALDRSVGRQIRVDGKRADLSVHFHRFPVVAFHPGDLALVYGGPADRRRFLDRMLYQARGGYASWHRQYGRALRSRNELLRRAASSSEVRAFDSVLAALGARMGEARGQVTATLRDATAEVLDELGVGAFGLRLRAAVEPDQSALAAALESSLAADRARCRTSVGPHTDDLVIERREGRAREVASRGEARALAVALRLAERRVVTDCSGCVPLLLLDDVAAELDRERTERVVAMVSKERGQVVVTATGSAEDSVGSGWKRFEIRGGQVAGVSGD